MGSETTRHTHIGPGGTTYTSETTVSTGRRAVKAATGGRAVKAPAKKKASWTLNLGIWTYNSGTGQYIFKVGKTLKYKSKTRSQRAANKRTKAAARQAERTKLAAWAEAQATPAQPPTTQTTGQQPGHPGSRKRGTSASAQKGKTTQPAPATSFTQHQQAMRAAGACGAKTADGSSCARRGHCPYHGRG